MKKRTKKKINSILAIFMSLAIIASGFGTPMAGLVAAAGENSAQQTEKTVEKTSVEKAPEQTGAKDETKSEGDNVDRTKPDSPNSSTEGKPATAPKIKKASSKEKKADKDDWSKGPNPDHLKGPEKANPTPIILDGNADPYLGDLKYKKAMKRAASRGGYRVPEPGQVELTKTAVPVPGKLNTFRVTLRMEATDKEQKNDIVLVIDTSGSMNDNGRIDAAKDAAKKFVDKLLDENHPNTRIALVSFETNVHLKKNFKNYTGKQELKNAIDALHAEGGTFTQGGMKQARDLLNGSTADFKNIVLLSDGVPTFNYKLNNPDNHLISGGPGSHTYEKQTDTNMSQSAFNYSKTTGAGNNMWDRYKRVLVNGHYEYRYYNSGNCAIAEAGYAKGNGAKVYTVAVEAGTQGNTVLNQMASPSCAYTAEPSSLSGVFGTIAASILSAMQNANVTDPMGAGFEVKGGTASNVHVTQGTATLNNNTINWNVGTLTESVAGNPMTRFAEMTYDVEVNDSILDVVSSNGNYNTNNGATVNYTDIDGNKQIKAFPEPTATPLLIGLYKELLDSRGEPIPADEARKRTFKYNVKLNEDGFNKDYDVKATNPRVMTDLKIDKYYTIEEKSVSGEHAGQLGDYKTSVKWKTFDGTQQHGPVNGTSINDFIVPKDSNNKPLNTRITVTNQEKDDGKLKLKKTFNPVPAGSRGVYGLRSATYRSAPSYAITVVGITPYGGSDELYRHVFNLTAGEEITIDNLPYGKYTVTEEGHTPAPTFVDTDGTHANGTGNDGKVSLLIDDKEASVEVINRPENNDYTTEVTAKKKWVNGLASEHTVPTFDLYADGVKKTGVTPTITPSGTANEFTYKWSNLQKYNTTGEEIKYTVKEAGVTSDNKFVINGHTYAVTQQDNEITNTYEIPKTDYTATKKWSGDTNVTRPTMTFTLWRKAGSVDEAVPGAEVKEVDGTTTTAKWTGLDKTTATGAEYSFYVKEAFKTASPENDNWILGNFDPATNSITNTVKTGEANLGKLTVKKKPLVNGPGVRSAFRGASLRGTPVKFGFTVTGPNNYSQTFELAPGESKELKNLYFGGYTVTETNAQGYTPSYAPGQNVTLKTDAKTETVEVTNTGGGAGTVVSKTVEKVWVNGPKPTTTIELWRKNNVEGSDKIDQKVDEFVVPENASGEQLKKTFANLAKHDPKGNEFEYYVKEETVPENYTKNIEVMKVTNTYTQPSAGKVTITKVWDGPANLTKPEVNLILYRKIEGGTEEQVPTAEAAVKVVDGSTTTAEWTGLKTKDINGKPYSFSVKESFKNAGDVNNGNWTLVDNTDVVNGAATITNKAVTGEDKLGKLTVTKKPLVNGPGVRSAFRGASLRGTPVKFGFTVTGPNNYSQTFELAPGESKELKNLYFGEYKVEETAAHGYTATYSVTDGKVTLKAEDKEKTVEVTNTSGGPGTVVEKTIKKVWVNGGKPDTVIELWRKGTAANGSAIDEKVGEFTANATKTEETFSNLAKHDPKGNEFEYYAKEPNVPGNYTDTYSADKLTVTNTYSQP